MEKLAKATFSWFGSTSTSDNWSPDDVDKLETYDIKKYHKTVDLCRFMYRKDPIGGTVLNKMVEIGITKLIFDKNKLSENEFRIFEAIKDKLQEFAESCALEYLISGLVIPEVRYGAMDKDTLFDLGIKKYQALTMPVSMWLRDPTTVKIKSIMMDEPSYFVKIPDELVTFIMNKGKYGDGTKDEKLWEMLNTYYPEFIADVQDGKKEILLENDLIVRRRVLTDSPYPTPYLYGSLEAMKHKRNLRRMDYSIASRVITAIMLVKMGDKDFPITEEDQRDGNDPFQYIKDQMAWKNSSQRNIERIFQIFANHTLSIEWIFPNVEALLNDAKYKEVNQDIFFGLGFPRILTTGETERTQTSDPALATISPTETMKNMQEKILYIIKGIVREVAKSNGLKSTPIVRFDTINLHAYRDFVEAITKVYNTANLSRTEYSKIFGYNWEDEVNKRADEDKLMKELQVGEFAPQPFSPQPQNNQQNPQQNQQNQQKKEQNQK